MAGFKASFRSCQGPGRVPMPCRQCSAKCPFAPRPLIGYPVNTADCLIGSPISSQRTALQSMTQFVKEHATTPFELPKKQVEQEDAEEEAQNAETAGQVRQT